MTDGDAGKKTGGRSGGGKAEGFKILSGSEQDQGDSSEPERLRCLDMCREGRVDNGQRTLEMKMPGSGVTEEDAGRGWDGGR